MLFELIVGSRTDPWLSILALFQSHLCRGEEQLFRSQPGRRGWAQRLFPRRAAAEPTAGAYGEASSQPEPVQDFQVFPRLKERDPYR